MSLRIADTEALTVRQFLNDDVRLPSPPGIALRIIDIVKQEDFSFNDLSAIIKSDPALAGRILRLANSGLYSLPRRVSNINVAVGVMGVNVLKNIALSFVLVQGFSGQREERFDFERLWRRSITAAVATQLIAGAIGYKSDDTFITSLFQDIGIGAMFMLNKDEYIAVLDEKTVSGKPVTVIERQIFGFDHQEVSAELLRKWGLPESVCVPIKYHHQPEAAPSEHRTMCEILRASDRLSAVYHGSDSIRNFRNVKGILSKTFGIRDEQAAELIDAAAHQAEEALSQFKIESRRIVPFSQILQEANEELSRLNLSYETLIIEHREAKQKAERLAMELKSANEKLRHYAFRDGLTGLYNHRFFQEAVDRELARASRHAHPLSLIMMDIDHFKDVNDVHGHQRGDAVLKQIAEIMQNSARRSDVVARYGGEEFAILLPETNLAGAEIKAEACRAAIEAAQVECEGVVVPATISVGVATFDPTIPTTRSQLINAADRALYRSKREGRNRVTTWKQPTIVKS